MNLQHKLANLPSNPGVYQYFDKNNRLLYVGKAKNLKNRIKSYFQFTPILAPSAKLSPRIYKMITEVISVEYIVVANENDALILENSLIKQLKPKYNILLRDDKTYPYIYIDTTEKFPRLDITRKIIKSKGIKYYGPFSVGARDILNSIYDIIPLVQKKGSLKGKKACLFYQIGKCLAPCENKITSEEYHKLINKAIFYIHNKSKLIEKLKEKMEQYSNDFRFEDAMILRDRINTIEKSHLKSTLDFANHDNVDLFSVVIQDNKAVIVKMFIRDGKLISTSHHFINTTEITTIEEIYKTAIVNYYSKTLPMIANDIIIAHNINNINELENFITQKQEKKVNIVVPKIGRKKELINVALQNCYELLKMDKSITNNINLDLKELFQLYKTPYRFECFDNSHLMGQATVGAMIVWDEAKFFKDDYRLYNLNSLDEYSQMKEMLTRRANDFLKNPPPDIWIIDGGKTLVILAQDILQSVGVYIDVIGISKEKIDAKAHRAKGSAKDILYCNNQFYNLQPSDKRLQFIQKLRDEAHRSAITFHKKQKRIEDKQISLLELHGIGQAKLKKLLNFFGTFDNIKTATIEQLCDILHPKDAKTIFEYFSLTK